MNQRRTKMIPNGRRRNAVFRLTEKLSPQTKSAVSTARERSSILIMIIMSIPVRASYHTISALLHQFLLLRDDLYPMGDLVLLSEDAVANIPETHIPNMIINPTNVTDAPTIAKCHQNYDDATTSMIIGGIDRVIDAVAMPQHQGPLMSVDKVGAETHTFNNLIFHQIGVQQRQIMDDYTITTQYPAKYNGKCPKTDPVLSKESVVRPLMR